MINKIKIRLNKDVFTNLTTDSEFTPAEIIEAAQEDAKTQLSVEVKNSSTAFETDPEYQTALIYMTIAVLYDRQMKGDGDKERGTALNIIRNKYASSISSGEFMPDEQE